MASLAHHGVYLAGDAPYKLRSPFPLSSARSRPGAPGVGEGRVSYENFVLLRDATLALVGPGAHLRREEVLVHKSSC